MSPPTLLPMPPMSPPSPRSVRGAAVTAVLACGLAVGSCGGTSGDAEPSVTEDAGDDPDRSIVELLEAGQPVFAIFSGEHTAEGGTAMAETRNVDFVFYSLESGPFDIPALETYSAALAEASGDRGTRPIVLRIPPIRDGLDEGREHMRQGLAAGVSGLVFPHVETAEQAAFTVSELGAAAWPANPDGHVFSLLLIEDQVGIDNVRAIAATPGISSISPGPGDLRRVYDGDMEKVEEAIQIVLAACLEFGVPCGVTAGADDVALRLEQGFRVIIVLESEALAVGMAAAGRGD